MKVYIVHSPATGEAPVAVTVYAARPAAIFDDQQMFERPLIGYEAPAVEPCPELPTPALGELVEFVPQPQVSVVIDVAAILSQCKTREATADLISDVVAAARQA